MTRLVSRSVALGLLCVWASILPVWAAGDDATPDFDEVYDLVRAHLRGVSEAELNRSAVEGLLAALAPRVSLVTNDSAAFLSEPLITQVRRFEGDVAYLRIQRVSDGLATLLRKAHQDLSRTGKVVGIVLDVRYCTGDDYAAACEVAGLFLKSARVLLGWDGGAAAVEPSSTPIRLPVAVLVNKGTGGSAEGMAAALREAGAALVLGSRTSGSAALKRQFSLKTGHRLLIADSPVKLADGTELSSQGIKPDIEVSVSPEDERAYFADPYRELPKPGELAVVGEGAGTGQPGGGLAVRRARPTEADLVRARRDGLPLDGDLTAGREAEPPRPVLQDPVLARAVDLLKGLAIVRQARP